MGNFEKLVVLTVLFLSAIVLAVQLNDGDDDAGSSDPSADAALVLDESAARAELEQEALSARDGAAAPGGRAESTGRPAEPGPGRPGAGPTLLDSRAFPAGSVRDAGEPVAGARTSPYGPDSIVLKPGLRESGIAGMLLFDLKEQLSWDELALELYGDERYVALLQNFNEEMVAAPELGEILVPTQDNTRGAGITGARRPRVITAASPTGEESSATRSPAAAAGGSGASAATDTATAPVAGRQYVVRDGDSLSKISDRFFGTKHRWKEIYEANRNVLDSPDWVKPGMTLIIPGVDSDTGVR